MYFCYAAAVFLAVVEIFFMLLVVDSVLFLAPKVQEFYRKNSTYLSTALVIILLALAIQVFKDHEFYKDLNQQPKGLLSATLKYSLNILLSFFEFVLGYIFYRKLVEKIREVKSRQSDKGGGF